MVMEKTGNNRTSGEGGDGDGGRSRSALESSAPLEMKNMSQSELYSLAVSSSSAFDLRSTENVVIPNIESGQASTGSITTTSPRRIFAFAQRRNPRYRRRISASQTEDEDPELSENRLILNSLEKLVAEGEMNDSNPRRVEGEVENKKRKRKSKEEELDVIKVNGEDIDLKFLASVADGAFEAELNKMTEGMEREDQLLGFLSDLEGRWGSSRKRRKYVDAADFVKALPTNWKILLSLRPRIRHRSLYCRRFVSPSGEHFKSCKEVAFYLKSQFETNDANPPEGAMMLTESDHRVDPRPGFETSLKRKLVVVKEEADPLQHNVTNENELRNSSQTGEGSSRLPESKNNSRNLKTRCMWCLGDFFREPVDAETLATSSGNFICPKCKREISGRLESTLSKFYQHVGK